MAVNSSLLGMYVGPAMAEPPNILYGVCTTQSVSGINLTEPAIKVFYVYVPGHETSEIGYALDLLFSTRLRALALNNKFL